MYEKQKFKQETVHTRLLSSMDLEFGLYRLRLVHDGLAGQCLEGKGPFWKREEMDLFSLVKFHV